MHSPRWDDRDKNIKSSVGGGDNVLQGEGSAEGIVGQVYGKRVSLRVSCFAGAKNGD